MKDFYEANKKMWDEFAKVHFESDDYNVKEFLAGETTLKPYELQELGIVKEKTLLHLQCHFGLETLSWAREGAIVTGVDFSPQAIKIARQLTEMTKLEAKFIESNIYDLPKNLSEKFDIVYTSIGVLCWLQDLKKWGEIVSYFLKPGGIFYIAEIHPFAMVFDEEHETELQLRYDYFHNDTPMEFEVEGTYAVKEAKIKQNKSYEWIYSFSDVINSLINAGLKIEFLNEYPFTVYKGFPFAEKESDGYWRLQNQKATLPLLFTLKARK
ncbi:MAG TPA: class I SAM-dependent methyltransferase [candidate division Zixibacteria bacterium]|nr:class I SAM-dependent methyltransferase [candidate division Zixibacteria bacterium]